MTPDITMCVDCGCPQRVTCYRYRAIPTSQWQSIFAAKIYNMGEDCKYYWAIEEDECRIREVEEIDKAVAESFKRMILRDPEVLEKDKEEKGKSDSLDSSNL